jgi:hypothetical protein
MRKHRHFAIVIAALLGTAVLAQRPDTPNASAGTAPAGLHRPSSRYRGASAPRLTVEALSLPPAKPLAGDRLLALTTDVTPLPPPPPPPPPPAASASSASGGVWAELRACESGGDYAADTGNGYYGAYQFSLATWEGLGLSGLPSEAPPAVQDHAAEELEAMHGWGQWPACAAALGLS